MSYRRERQISRAAKLRTASRKQSYTPDPDSRWRQVRAWLLGGGGIGGGGGGAALRWRPRSDAWRAVDGPRAAARPHADCTHCS